MASDPSPDGCTLGRLRTKAIAKAHRSGAGSGQRTQDGCIVHMPWRARSSSMARAKWCFRHQLLLPHPYLVLTKPLRLDIQCQRAASVKIGWKYLDN